MTLYIPDKLSNSIDNYIKDGIKSELDDELKDLFELSMEINDINIEISEEEKSIAYTNMINKSKEEKNNMNKNKKKIFNKVASLALVGLIGFASSQTSFAQDIYQKMINLKYITVEESLPNTNSYEDKQVKEEDKYDYLFIKDLEEANDHMEFDLKVPNVLPSGYEFSSVCFYVYNTEDISGERASIIYDNGEKDFFIMQVLAKDDNKFITRGHGIEEINIDGRKAVIDKNGNIDIEIDDVLLTILTKGHITRDEAIEIIKSIQ